MERKMIHTCVDSALAELSFLEQSCFVNEINSFDHWIQSSKVGLRFLRMFFWSLFTLEDTDAEIRNCLMPVNHICEAIWGMSRTDDLLAPSSLAKKGTYFLIYSFDLKAKTWLLDLQGKIDYSLKKIEDSCELVLLQLKFSLRCNSFKKKKLTVAFLDAILENLKDLCKYKSDDEILLIKNQITTLEKKLSLLNNLLFFTPKKWRCFKEMREFKVVVHSFAHYSASLLFLYWVKAVDEEMATKLNLLLFNALQKIKPCDPVFKAFCFRFLKEMKLMQLDSLLLGKIIQLFLDLLLEDLVHILKDDFQILQESLMFFIAFLANPPDQDAEDEELMMITAEIEVLVFDKLYLVLSVDDMNDNLYEANGCLSDFMRKVQLVKGKIQQVYDQIRDSFSFSHDFPKTNVLGFFDFQLQNLGFLKEKLRRDADFIPFAKNMIIRIEEELMSLRPYLNDLFKQQKVQETLKDTWLRVINVAYQTQYAINTCSVIGHPLWYNMARLMEVLNETKAVKSKLNEIEGRMKHDGGVLHLSTVALNKVPEDPWASNFHQVMVGLEGEVDIIVENLTRGSRFLDIVAIVGMAGLGKTTLANKVYNAPAVRQYFHVLAYCIVSQVHNSRRILIDILGDIKGKDDKMYDMEEEELENMLRRCLRGIRYLIIMDDIWDIKAWDGVKRSLPNDQSGSRVIFTTRVHNVALQAKNDCIVHHLRFLSDEESWELLRKKAFSAEGCPPDFSEVGKMIAKNCKGLPLTIVLIAGLLARTERSLSWWNKISETTRSYISMEGCMDVLELSYQHLPEHLKPCFLYFGAFPEDALIRVNKLMLLWIAEGFVLNSNKENLEIVAKEYLCDLVDRSLVIVNERSSYGGIKSCRIHGLVHEFCQGMAREENLFQLMSGYEASNSSSFTERNPYRVYMNGKYLSDTTKICPSVHSLLDRHKTYDSDYHYVSNLKLVQVLDLEGKQNTDKCLSEIDSLVHLRFTATSFLYKSKIIVPSSISNLWNLEFLILTGIETEVTLPETIWNMTRLRHVDVGLCLLSDLVVKKRELAYPQLVNLESFSSPCIFSTKHLEDLLQRLPSLRKLSFRYTSVKQWMDSYYSTRLDYRGELESQIGFHFPELDSLSKLESLKVSCKRAELPSYPFYADLPVRLPFNIPSTLKKLSLSKCYADRRYLPRISKMPCLEVLKLLEGAFVGREWDMKDTEFPKLKFLKLEMPYLQKWLVFVESFPRLEVLIVNVCFVLNTIPPCFGEVPTLKRIEVYASYKAATSVVEIQEAQKDLGNEELRVIVSDNKLRKYNEY